jgi:23S rRNA pseudouridine2605 synthase
MRPDSRGNAPSRAPKKAPTKTSRPAKKAAPKPSPASAREPSPKDEGRERLHVRIAHAGLCSRRAAEKMIQEGRVAVNGKIVREMGIMVLPEDEVLVDGQTTTSAKQYTIVMNKPKGVVTTLSDPEGRPTIAKILPDFGVQLKPVGRLDMETEGLLICTNDGELAHRLMHPRYGIEKEYIAVVKGEPGEKAIQKLRKGIYIETGKTAPAEVDVLPTVRSGNSTSLRIVLHEGKKRQVRLMCEAVGHPVLSLKRVRIGPLLVRGMRGGECRVLGQLEVDNLRRLVGLE